MTTHSVSKSFARVTSREIVVLVLSVLLLMILAADFSGLLGEESMLLLYWFDTIICTAFLIDFFIGLYRANHRWDYVRRNWVDFVSSIPLVPVLRAGRIVRVVRILRLFRAMHASNRILAYFREKRKGSTLVGTVTLVLMVTLVSSAAILEFEGGAGSNIQSAGDALWWSITTMTTVGYGDLYPATIGGRFVSVFPMFCGIGVFALVTSLVSSWFLGEEEEKQSAELKMIASRLEAIEKTLEKLSR